MAYNLTATRQVAFLNWFRGVPVDAPPATFYLALCTADPGDAGAVANECAAAGYARVAVAFAAPTAVVGQPKHEMANSAVVSIGPLPAGATVSHILLCRSGVAGTNDAEAYGVITDAGGTPTPTVVDPGKVFVIQPGKLLLRMG